MKKWIFVLLIGLWTMVPGHALDFSDRFNKEVSQEEVKPDSHDLPYHFEQIHLLSLQQATQQGQSGYGSLLHFPDSFHVFWSSNGAINILFLQDIRSLLETQLFPFHSFW